MNQLAKSIFDHATKINRVAAESYRNRETAVASLSNHDLAKFLENEACYAANEARNHDAEQLREAARRLRGEPLDEAELRESIGAAVERMEVEL